MFQETLKGVRVAPVSLFITCGGPLAPTRTIDERVVQRSLPTGYTAALPGADSRCKGSARGLHQLLLAQDGLGLELGADVAPRR